VIRRRLNVAAFLAVLAIAASLVLGVQPVSAGPAYLRGVDVSDWQGKPRWAAVKSAGIKFVIAKATNGNIGRDPEYVRNRARCRKLGIAFTAYHHGKPDASPGDAVAEADNFVDFAGLKGNDLVPVLELKKAGTLTPEQATDWAKAFLARVVERIGVKPMIYASDTFWTDHMGDSTWFADNGYRLWVRDWANDTPTIPASNWAGHGWTIWQDGKALVPGIAGKVDTNFFNGTVLAPLRIKNNR
jgi:lysozyme